METVDATPPPTVVGAPAAVTVNKEELTRALGCALPTLVKLIDRYPKFPIERRGHEGFGYRTRQSRDGMEMCGITVIRS